LLVIARRRKLGPGGPLLEHLIATPASMQAWNSLAEIDDRTIMRNGQWTAA